MKIHYTQSQFDEFTRRLLAYRPTPATEQAHLSKGEWGSLAVIIFCAGFLAGAVAWFMSY